MAELVRINTRISKGLNEWLDKHSKETGLPKSQIIMLSCEYYRREKEVMSDMTAILTKLQELEQKIGK